MKTSLALLIAGALSFGAARAHDEIESVEEAEERVENLVDVIDGFVNQNNNVVVIIVRNGIKIEIPNVVSALGDRRLMKFSYVSPADRKTYEAAVDVEDVLLIMERPKE